MHPLLRCCLTALLFAGCACAVGHRALGESITLYDDTLGTLPGDQPNMIYFGLGMATQAVVAEGVEFVSDQTAQAGFTPEPSIMPVLDPSRGFSVDFELQVLNETHVSDDRAGFSLILLGDDNRGVELGFWANEIWAQSDTPLFTHAEGVAFDTTAALTDYRLQVYGDSYQLRADDILILSGPTRDYTPFTGLIDPYEVPNYLFLGDNTTRASAGVILGEVRIQDCCPEPASNFPAMLSILCGFLLQRRTAETRRRISA